MHIAVVIGTQAQLVQVPQFMSKSGSLKGIKYALLIWKCYNINHVILIFIM